jgi:hypothetical protein
MFQTVGYIFREHTSYIGYISYGNSQTVAIMWTLIIALKHVSY